jgi:hypothetical protein
MACAMSSPDSPFPRSCSSPTGADTSVRRLPRALLNMKAQKLPVFTVGVGSERLPKICRSIG